MTATPQPTQSIVVFWSVDNGTSTIDEEISTSFTWPDVDISYDAFNTQGKVRLEGQNVRAKIMLRTFGPDGEPNYLDTEYTLQSIRLTSSHPTNDNWDRNYGGVSFYSEIGPVNKDPGVFSVCGIEENRDSGYIYTDVFEKTDFSYIPFNESDVTKVADGESYQFEPFFPDVTDPSGKAAPILPMNSITSFVPDGREDVTITYTATFIGEYNGTTVESQCDITQVCEQDTNDYGDLLQSLLTYCNWANTRGIPIQDFSYLYPYQYPYTYVTPTDPLEQGFRPSRGDIWFNDSTQQRFYYNSGDIPQTFTVIEPGSGYKDREDVQAVWTVPTDDNGQPLRRCDYELDENNVPHGLTVNITSEKGKIVSAVVSDFGSPAGFKDGDIVSVLGGNNDAKLRVNISNTNPWTTIIVKQYGT
jgi:hypothetical protein